MILSKLVPTGVKAFATKTGLKIAKHSPELLIGFGVVTVTAAAVYGVYVGLTGAEDILDEHNAILDNIHAAEKDATVEAIGMSKASLYRKTAIAFLKLFMVPALLIIAGDAMIIGGYVLQARRTAEAVAALSSVTAAFAAYRANVVKDQGELKDLEYYYGKEFVADMEIANSENVDMDERKEAARRIHEKIKDKSELVSEDWSILFDERSKYYQETKKDNRIFISNVEQYWNDILQQRALQSGIGWVMVNETIGDVNLPKFSKGFDRGWTWDPNETPEPPRISLGADWCIDRETWLAIEPRIWLCPNVQPGLVSDRLSSGGWMG